MESSPSSSRGHATFFTQADALLRKNLTFQKRNLKTNVGIVAFPVFLCALIVGLQEAVNSEFDREKYRCGCREGVCGLQFSTLDQVASCPIPSPPGWPPLFQVPRPEYRAVAPAAPSSSSPIDGGGLPDASCRASQSCPPALLFTGANQSFATSLAQTLFLLDSASPFNISDFPGGLSDAMLGTDTPTRTSQFIEPAFLPDTNRPLYALRSQCAANGTSTPISFQVAGRSFELDLVCTQPLTLWRNTSALINEQMFRGYRQGNPERALNEYIAAYDFLNSDGNVLNISIWYNSTYNNDTVSSEIGLLRVPKTVNLASNAYLKFRQGAGVMVLLEYLKEMPKAGTKLRLDISSLLGALFFTWIIELLFPVILSYLVYEKQQKLKLMMKMHGLKDGPYWLISYIYFFSLSSLYMACFVVFGSAIDLNFFKFNDYGIQILFYFVYINLQIAMAFLSASWFSSVKTATMVGYIYVFGSGLLGEFLLVFFIEDSGFPRGWIRVMEIFPGFSLYRGLYEFSQYSSSAYNMGIDTGMRWGNLKDSENGMKEVLIIMLIEWLVLLPLAFYLDQLFGNTGVRKNPLFFLSRRRLRNKQPTSLSQRMTAFTRQESKVLVQMEKPDVSREREVVEQLLAEPGGVRYAVVADNLRKVYPGRDGNPDKLAVRGLSLALPRGECFGMLGPNGAGKTSFISMMIGLIPPTSGTAFVEEMDITTNMDEIYSNIGVCPQYDLLWETLTGREHLLFYGRLKNLKGAALLKAVDESLRSVNLFYGGVADKQAGKYSGGMKRRLSVAISLIGNPKVVYMDEPSTGLDPASRNHLWNVVKQAKKDRAIILTTHSMEEAEVLCDRLGVFVDGGFQCIGNPNELKARYGGSFVFTITTSAKEEEEVESLARQLSPNANKIYHISGTQKFELPKQEVKIADVFRAVQMAKTRFTVQAWGLADTTLEDVFIKVAKEAHSFNLLS